MDHISLYITCSRFMKPNKKKNNCIFFIYAINHLIKISVVDVPGENPMRTLGAAGQMRCMRSDNELLSMVARSRSSMGVALPSASILT